jgi:hypothetical protein
VILMNARRVEVLNVRYSVFDFMVTSIKETMRRRNW